MRQLWPVDSLECLCFAGPNRLAAGGWDGQLRVWGVPDGDCQLTLGAAIPRARGLTISTRKSGAASVVAAGEHLVSGHQDGLVRRWSLRDGSVTVLLSSASELPWTRGLVDAGLLPHSWRERPTCDVLALHPDGVHLLEAGTNTAAQIWDLRTGARALSLGGSSRAPLALHPEGRYVLCQSSKSVHLYHVYTGQLRREYPFENLHGLAISPDGRTAAMSNWEQLAVFDLQSGQTRGEVGTGGTANALAWHPSGRWLVGAYDKDEIRVWDAETLEQLVDQPCEGQWRAVEVSSDGQRVAWGGSQGAWWTTWDKLVSR